MTATITTLNISVEQIESDLRHGRTVQQIAQDWQEPVSNVLAVKRAMEASGERFAAPPKPPSVAAPVAAVGARPATSAQPATATSAAVGQSALSVDALVAAAARSTSKRTQALGVRLADLAKVVRDRLAEERAAAEKAEAAKREREHAAAEVERLEAQLRAARAKLRGRRAGGGSTPMPREPREKAPLSEARRAQLAENRKKQYGEWPCRVGCGRVSTTAAGRSSHERNCGGAS